MKWVGVFVLVFMTIVTASSVALDVKRVNLLQGRAVGDGFAWLRASLWTAMLYFLLLATWEAFR